MGVTGFLAELLLLIALAAAGVALFQRIRLPAIAGFLVIGALVGPGVLGLVDDVERVRDLAELGVVFLLFEIGLELPLERVRRLWRRSLAAGGLQVAITVLAVAAASIALGLEAPRAWVLGALVAMSSTALVMRLLSDRGEIDAPQGQIAVGILLFQDLCIVPFLLAVPLLAAGGSGDLANVSLDLVVSAFGLVGLAIVARFLLPWLLDRVAQLRSRDLFTLVAVVVVLGSALAADALGLTLSVGAFVGGLALSASPYAHQLFAEVIPLRGVLIGLFFTAVGMLFDPVAAVAQWPAVLGYISFVLLLKAAVVAGIVALVLGQGVRLGVVTGLALAQTGEFSFVLAEAAAREGLLDRALHQVFIAGSVGTLVATPFLMTVAPRVGQFLASWSRRGPEPRGPEADDPASGLRGHAVLIGFGLGGRMVARVLRARDIPYVAVEANARTVIECRERGETILYGDATRREILERLGVAKCRLVIVAVSDPLATRRIVTLSRELAPDATILVRTRYVLEVDALAEGGASTVVAEEFESTLEVLSEALQVFGVPDGAIARFVAELRDEGYELMRAPTGLGLDPWLGELLEQVSTSWVAVPDEFGEATLVDLGVRARTGANVLAVDRGGETLPNPPPSFSIQPGDRLLVFGGDEAVRKLRELMDEGAAS